MSLSIPDQIQEAVDDDGPRVYALTDLEMRKLLIAAQIGANSRRDSAQRKWKRLQEYLVRLNEGTLRGNKADMTESFHEAISEAHAECDGYWRLIRKVSNRKANVNIDDEGNYNPPKCGCWSTDCHYIGILCEGPQRAPYVAPTAEEMAEACQAETAFDFEMSESEFLLVNKALRFPDEPATIEQSKAGATLANDLATQFTEQLREHYGDTGEHVQ